MVSSSDSVYNKSKIDEIEPSFAYEQLINFKNNFLIDVRCKPEWSFVGFPDDTQMKNEIIFCEWSIYPFMEKNLNFENEIFSKIDFENCENLYFLCRSGSRSFEAANSIKHRLNEKAELKKDINCINVKFGFEGDLSNENKRGKLNGWKFSNLPWKQL